MRRWPARPIRGRATDFYSAALGSWSEASPPRSTARRLATCAGGATLASSWRFVCAAPDHTSVLPRFAALPQIVALVEHRARRLQRQLEALGYAVSLDPIEHPEQTP